MRRALYILAGLVFYPLLAIGWIVVFLGWLVTSVGSGLTRTGAFVHDASRPPGVRTIRNMRRS